MAKNEKEYISFNQYYEIIKVNSQIIVHCAFKYIKKKPVISDCLLKVWLYSLEATVGFFHF